MVHMCGQWYWVYFALILPPPIFWQIKQGCMSMVFLFTPNYVWSYCVIPPHLPKQMAIFQPITPYLLFLFSLLFLTSIIMYSPCLTLLFSPPASDPPSIHPVLTSFLCPAFCFNVDFTLLMFVMSLFSMDVKSTFAAKPPLNSSDFWTEPTGKSRRPRLTLLC